MSIVKADQPAEFRPYITTTKGMSGYFAVMMWYNNEGEHGGFWEPWDTGVGRYQTQDEAIAEAKAWASDEGVAYRA